VIDIRQILSALTQAIVSTDVSDAAILATALDLDISSARITKTKTVMAVSGARLKSSGVEANIAWGLKPRREIWMMIGKFSLPYQDVKDEIFGANQRIKSSKLSTGFGVLFEIDGWTCGYTAHSPDSDLDAIFCEEPKPAPAP